ncbi:MAG: hypothetical protein LBS27_01630 [Bifidobacteriaceae bacterium]|jgi:hypothetical protein|nr:hypothetical protein [Bifidobacteriaceae bacterium]
MVTDGEKTAGVDPSVLVVTVGTAVPPLMSDELAGVPVQVINLPREDREQWEDQLARELAARSHGPSVVWAWDPKAATELARAIKRFDDVLAVSTRQAALGVVAALRAGRSVASMVYPRLATADKALSQAGLDQARFSDGSARLELIEGPAPAWLTITTEGARVSTDGLTPLELAAMAERAQSATQPAGAAERAQGADQPTGAAERAKPAVQAGRPVAGAAGVAEPAQGAAQTGPSAAEATQLARPAQPTGAAGTIQGAAEAGRPGRLLIGSANYAGQGRAWAEAVNRHVPGFRAVNLQLRTFTAQVFDADVLMRVEEFASPVARVDLALELVAPASHILLEDMRAPVGLNDLREPDIVPRFGRLEAEQFLASGRRVACLVHGTAGREPAGHRSLEPWSPYREPESDFYQARERAVNMLRESLDGLDAPLFVATPDMLEYFDQAHWLPIVARPDDFAPAPPWEPGRRLKVAHAPSSDIMKGSEFVDPALRRLEESGLIEYTSVRGVPPLAVPRLLRQVDVVVDQVVLGNPATLLIQTMAAGRLAVANVSPTTRRRFPEPLPVVQADPSTIAEAIADIAADPQAYQALVQAGPGFARRFHDGRLSAEVLNRHFLSSGVAR